MNLYTKNNFLYYSLGIFLLFSCSTEDMVDEPADNIADLDVPEQMYEEVTQHFTHTPLPLDKLTWISCLGDNGKVLPIGHTYWNSCGDFEMIPNTDLGCFREKMDIFSPGDGKVHAIEEGPDGCITFTVNPSIYWTFCHVDPKPGLTIGDEVKAGQKIATMFTDFAFDFGIINYHIENEFISEERYAPPLKHAQHPIDQFTEPLRSQLISRLPGNITDIGSPSFDVEGTAAGAWFLEGAPEGPSVFEPGGGQYLLYLGPLVQNRATQLMNIENYWDGLVGVGRSLFVDEGNMKWADIKSSTGQVHQIMWGEDFATGTPNTNRPLGSVLLELLDDTTLKIEWFNTHNTINEFTSNSRIYNR